jgi:hypothetical protein
VNLAVVYLEVLWELGQVQGYRLVCHILLILVLINRLELWLDLVLLSCLAEWLDRVVFLVHFVVLEGLRGIYLGGPGEPQLLLVPILDVSILDSLPLI